MRSAMNTRLKWAGIMMLVYSIPFLIIGIYISVCLDGFDVVVVASTDLSHYIPRNLASHLDGLVLDRICSLDVPGMYRTVRDNRVSMCGYGPTAVAMMMSERCEASVLCHSDSFNSLGMDPDSVVDYASVTFTKRP